jgi:hypothetical protein
LKSEAKSILVIKPSSLGDIVHTLPAVAAVRDAYPHAEITWVINPEWSTLLRGNPHISARRFQRSECAPDFVAVAEEDAIVAPGRGP